MKKIYSIWCTLFCLIISTTLIGQNPGTFNTNFGSNGYQFYDVGSKDQFGKAVAVQNDGKIVVGCMHEHTNGKYDWLIYRLNTNGSLDNTFSGDGKYMESYSDEDHLVSVGVQSDGKIVVAGFSNLGSGDWDIFVHRLNANGTLDNTFGSGGTAQFDRSIGGADALTRMIITPDDKIYLGCFMEILSETYFMVYRLKPDGTPDSTFSADGNVFYNTKTQAVVTDMAVAQNGDVALSGYLDDNGLTKMTVVKFNAKGKLDKTFATDGIKTFTPGLNKEGGIMGITFLPNNKLVGVGIKLGADNNAIILQLTASGLLDGAFNGNGMLEMDLTNGDDDRFEKIERLANGKYLVLARTDVNFQKGSLYQLNTDGSVDDANYGSGVGKLEISISNDDEYIAAMACNNDFVYTVGHFSNGPNADIFVTSSNLFNPISIAENQFTKNSVKVFPNPANASHPLTIVLGEEIEGKVTLELMSITGEKLFKSEIYKTITTQNHSFQVPNLSAGLYVLQIENNGKLAVQKLIIQ